MIEETLIDEQSFGELVSIKFELRFDLLDNTRWNHVRRLRKVTFLTTLICVLLFGCSSHDQSVRQIETFIRISTYADNLSPLLLEQQIAIPIETALRQIQSIERLSLHIVNGFVCFRIEVVQARTPNSALTEIRHVVERVTPTFPDEATKPTIELVKEETNMRSCPPVHMETYARSN